VALAAVDMAVALGSGYPGTPATDILESFSAWGGRGQWAPNEKVALEVGIGAAFAGARALVAMKHVGLNVAADPFFIVAYTGVDGALVVVSADDPGMASSQNEQDNRLYAAAAGVPMLEPSDSQEAYDLARVAVHISERWRTPVLLRLTTRVCHSKSVVGPRPADPPRHEPRFVRDIEGRVMIPSHARPAHRRLREKLAQIAAWNESWPGNFRVAGAGSLGIVTSGVSYAHVREAAPDASVFKLAMTYPLPFGAIRSFAASVTRCLVVEEGDPYLADSIRAAGIPVEAKDGMYRFGEMDVGRVRRIVAGDTTPEPAAPAGQLPQLCPGCPHRMVFDILHKLDCIVAGDIGCYTLGALPPYRAMDSQLCMGAAIGVGLGLRHVLPEGQARRVVSVIGDSTFIHSGITGLVEMVYNPPATGHVLLILDNGATAMTGHQEHPGTGRTLDHRPTGRVVLEDLARALGVPHVYVLGADAAPDELERALARSLESSALCLIVVRRPCMLLAKQTPEHERKPQTPA
jgi:indolepyruvate ferredoxin oxidoreductase alpha subunit